MPATISHSLSMTTPNDPAYEKVLKRREANRRSYYKHHDERKKKSAEYQRKRHAENKDHVRALRKAWDENNKERIAARRRIVRPSYKERERAYAKKYYVERAHVIKAYYENHKEQWRAHYREWSKKNLDKEAARAARRRAGIDKATPPWADIGEINKIYAEAFRMSQQRGVKFHVDHIIPLRGRNVCGLHVHWNLQIIEAIANLRKGNSCPEASTIN